MEIGAQFVNRRLRAVETRLHPIEPRLYLIEATLYSVEPDPDGCETFIHELAERVDAFEDGLNRRPRGGVFRHHFTSARRLSRWRPGLRPKTTSGGRRCQRLLRGRYCRTLSRNALSLREREGW